MSNKRYTDELKIVAAKQVTEAWHAIGIFKERRGAS